MHRHSRWLTTLNAPFRHEGAHPPVLPVALPGRQVARIAASRVNTRSDAICSDSEARAVLKPPLNAPVRAVLRRFSAL